MKKRLRNLYLILSSFFIAILHLPFAVAKTATGTIRNIFTPFDSTVHERSDSMQLIPALRSVYDSLHLNLAGLSQQAFDYAKKGLNRLIQEGKLLNDSIISIIDFSLPSSKKRLFVLDLKHYKVLFNTLVAHGRNSGLDYATSFSNSGESYKSSPGFYVTQETYEGKNGYSLQLEGVERGINDNALDRGIVLHGAAYVCDEYVNAQGYIGRSQGCPAVPAYISNRIINTIKNGTCLFIYHPSYVNRSIVLR